MIANIITAEKLRTSNGRDYNPRAWDEKIDKFLSDYTDVVFYHVPKGNGYDYDRYYAEYTLPEGLRLMSSFGYSGVLSNGGFFRVDLEKVTSKGLTIKDALDAHIAGDKKKFHRIWEAVEASSTVRIEANHFYDGDGNKVLFNNSPEARQEMIKRSKNHGVTFTKGL